MQSAADPGCESAHSVRLTEAQSMRYLFGCPSYQVDTGGDILRAFAVAIFMPAAVDAEFHNCVTVIFLFLEIKGVYS